MRLIVADLVQSEAPICWSLLECGGSGEYVVAELRVPALSCKMFYGGLGDVAG